MSWTFIGTASEPSTNGSVMPLGTLDEMPGMLLALEVMYCRSTSFSPSSSSGLSSFPFVCLLLFFEVCLGTSASWSLACGALFSLQDDGGEGVDCEQRYSVKRIICTWVRFLYIQWACLLLHEVDWTKHWWEGYVQGSIDRVTGFDTRKQNLVASPFICDCQGSFSHKSRCMLVAFVTKWNQGTLNRGVEWWHHKNEPFDSWEWSMSHFSCSLSLNITSHSMENFAFHSLLRWEIIIRPILTTSLIHRLLKMLGECTF